jgi:hypothetical protein
MLRNALILMLFAVLSGCATYGNDVQDALRYTQAGQPEKAEVAFQKVVEPDGSDRLLYFMEMGVLKHLSGDYNESNRLLEQAERIVEELYTQSISESLMVAMSNPTVADYKGQIFEDVYINYYKALNYLFLADAATGRTARADLLDSALVEARRLDNKLTKLKNERGTYDEAAEEEEETFSQILNLFEKLLGNYIDESALVFRENAYSHYLSGLLFEQQKEWDDARISYQKAAELYEKGYAKQVGVGQDMIGQAWLDTIRMMEKAGGWKSSISQLKWDKLDDDLRDKLRDYKNSDAELVVLNHLDFVPQKKEMNFVMHVEPARKEMVLTPLLTDLEGGSSSDMYAWFWMMYADKGILDVVERYSNGGLDNIARTFINKRVPLGPAWDLVESLNIDTALKDGGVRVAVPYYAPVRKISQENEVSVNGITYPLVKAESLARLAINEQILSARTDLYEALARETLKNTIIVETARSTVSDSPLLSMGLKMLTATTARADTRTWLTLPAEVHVVRIPMESGEHDVSVSNSFVESVSGPVSKNQTISLKKGEIRVLRQRSFPPLSSAEQQVLAQTEAEGTSDSAFGKLLN